MPFRLIILGSSSATPTSNRHPSAQLLIAGPHHFLLDCSEGTQMQLRKMKFSLLRIDHIFITHLHGDHFFGLIGLITSFHLLGRTTLLHIHCLPELKEVIELQLSVTQTPLVYPIEYHFLEPSIPAIVFEDKHLSVESIPLQHSIPTCGFLFREKEKPRNINKEAIKGMNLTFSQIVGLKEGQSAESADGVFLDPEHYTFPAPKPCSYAYCTDTGYFESLAGYVADVDLLFHEATFQDKEMDLARAKLHSTASDAANIAKMAGVKKLLLGHFSARYKDLNLLLSEARKIFPETYLAEEGNEFFIDSNP